MTAPFMTTRGDGRALMDLYPELETTDERRQARRPRPPTTRPARRAPGMPSALFRVAAVCAVVAVTLLLGIAG